MMDARVVLSLVLMLVSLVEAHSDTLSQEPVGNSGIGTFWHLMQQLFKLEGKVENQLKHMEDDIEELKSKVENGLQDEWKEETDAMKTDIENLSQKFERAESVKGKVENQLKHMEDDIEELKSKVENGLQDEWKEETDAMKTDIEKLSQKFERAESDSQALEVELVKLQESNAALTEGITALEESNSELRQDMAALKSNSELQKPVSRLPSTERLFLCEHNRNSSKGSISCGGRPGTYLHIEFAHYGRRARDICVHPSIPSTFTGCTKGLAKSLEIVRGLCQGKASCQLQARNSVFGDPCVGTAKYLEVQYTCKLSG